MPTKFVSNTANMINYVQLAKMNLLAKHVSLDTMSQLKVLAQNQPHLLVEITAKHVELMLNLD